MASAADGFQIDASMVDGVARLRLAGELDAATAPLLATHLADAAAAGAREVVLECRGLDFIDSSGLSVLVAGHKQLRGSGGRLVLESPPLAARRLFEIAGLDRVLTIRDSGPDATGRVGAE